jgi:hypothetical protein
MAGSATLARPPRGDPMKKRHRAIVGAYDDQRRESHDAREES